VPAQVLGLRSALIELHSGAVGSPGREDWAQAVLLPLPVAPARSIENPGGAKQISADPAWAAALAHSHREAFAQAVVG
jgi:hypothetical protein